MYIWKGVFVFIIIEFRSYYALYFLYFSAWISTSKSTRSVCFHYLTKRTLIIQALQKDLVVYNFYLLCELLHKLFRFIYHIHTSCILNCILNLIIQDFKACVTCIFQLKAIAFWRGISMFIIFIITTIIIVIYYYYYYSEDLKLLLRNFQVHVN